MRLFVCEFSLMSFSPLEQFKSTHVGHVHELTKALINWNSFTISPSPADVM